MENKGLLTIIIVILLGIFTLIAVQMNERSPAEKIGDGIGEAFEEVGDEIDDNVKGN